MFKFLHRKPSPKEVAKSRLELMLIHDRGDLSPKLLDMIKSEILDIIKKYINIDMSDVRLNIIKTFDNINGESFPSLIANIPIKSNKQKSS